MQKVRQSNMELLRIIAMTMIVLFHFLGQGGVLDHTSGPSYAVAFVLSQGGRISVNLFLMIGCWFMCDSPFRASKVLRLWGEVFFYTTVITLLTCMVWGAPMVSVIQAFFPFFAFPLWFACVYIFLMLMSPFLRHILALSRRTVRSLLLLGFLAIPVFCSLHKLMDTRLDDFLWFMYVFLFIGYYKKYLSQNGISKGWFLLAGIGMYLVFIVIHLISRATDNTLLHFLEKVAAQYRRDIKSLPNFACSLCLFLFFTELELPVHKTINTIASSVFAVYIIHQTPVFFDHLWYDVMRIGNWYDSPLLFPYIALCVVALYAGCMLMDAARKKWIEPLWVRSSVFRFAEEKISGLYSELLSENIFSARKPVGCESAPDQKRI